MTGVLVIGMWSHRLMSKSTCVYIRCTKNMEIIACTVHVFYAHCVHDVCSFKSDWLITDYDWELLIGQLFVLSIILH